MKKYNKNIANTIFIIFFIFIQNAYSQTKEECDLLIKKGIDTMYAQKYMASIKLHKEAYDISLKHNWYKQHFLAINNLGLNYFQINDYQSAIKYYLEAYTFSTKNNQPVDEMVVLNNIAILYISEKNLEKANKYFLKALFIARDINEERKIGYYLTNLGLLQIDKSNMSKAKEYLTEAKTYLIKDKRVLLSAKIGLLKIDLEEKKYNHLINEGTKLLNEAIRSNFFNESCEIQLTIGKAYYQENKPALALKFLYSGLAKSKTLDLKIEFYKLIAEIYELTSDYKKALQYKDSLNSASEIIYKKRNAQLYENNKLRFELLNSEKDLALEEISNSAKRKNLILIIISLSLFTGLMILIFKRKIKSYKRLQKIKEVQLKNNQIEILKHNSNNILLKEKIVLNERAALKEQERLKLEIEQRNLKITEKILFQSSKNELICNILKTLDEHMIKLSDTSLPSVVENLKKYLSEETKWEDYISTFENVNPKFIKSLKYNHQNLTSDDIRFLSYIYLNFDTKDISSLLNITPEGVRKRKERVSKKLNLDNSIKLQDYIISL